MITGELKSKVDKLWTTFWSNGVSNPLSVIEQMVANASLLANVVEVEYAEVVCESPKVILEKLKAIEDEIRVDLDELEGMLI